MKPARPVAPAPLTEEQKKEQVLRYIAQQRSSIYQMALANIIQANPVGNTGGDAYERREEGREEGGGGMTVKTGDLVTWKGKGGEQKGQVAKSAAGLFVVTDKESGKGVPLNDVITSESFRVCTGQE